MKICVVGLGYVGLPLARLFSTKHKTIGYDVNASRVSELMRGHDSTGEVEDDVLQAALDNGFICTSNIDDIRDCNFYVIAVPTPIDSHNKPDLAPLLGASKTVGGVLKEGDIVVYESTTYPGCTEDECIPVLEKISGLVFNEEFFVGYSPERINPGDKEHTVAKIRKVTSGSTPEIADMVDAVYNSVLINGTFKASSIRVAEASKIIENTQRDINIAYMNELSRIFTAMGIDMQEVLDAASTKWNFIRLKPGLVGGHCISVDPYYLIQRAKDYGINPQLMISARDINDSMGRYVGDEVIRCMNKKGLIVLDSDILILGITFKENCPDIRNTKIIDVYDALGEYTSNITVYDPHADAARVNREYGISIVTDADALVGKKYDAVILGVAHDDFKTLDLSSLIKENGVIYDVKGILDKNIVDGRL